MKRRGFRCNRCRHAQTSHDERDGARSPGFTRFYTDPTRRTQSFAEEQLHLLHFLVTGIMQGRDVTMAMRHPEWPRLVRKVKGMREKSLKAKKGRTS